MARCPAHGNRIQLNPSRAVNLFGATPQPDCRRIPIDIRQGFGHRQLGLMQQPPQSCLLALLVLLLRQHIEVAGRAPAVGLGLLFGRLPLAAELRQFQLFEQGWQGCFQCRPAGGFHPGVRHSC